MVIALPQKLTPSSVYLCTYMYCCWPSGVLFDARDSNTSVTLIGRCMFDYLYASHWQSWSCKETRSCLQATGR